jgi:hypothetical protein
LQHVTREEVPEAALLAAAVTHGALAPKPFDLAAAGKVAFASLRWLFALTEHRLASR